MKNLSTIDKLKNIAYPLATFIGIIFIWEITVVKFSVPSYILPSPKDIYLEFVNDWQVLAMHSRVTLKETVIGLLMSVIISLLIGMIMDFVPFIKKCFHPIMYVTQMIPTITIAPLLVIWFGFGIKSKVICVILTCFFPMLINFIDGMDSIDRDLLNLFKIMKANRLKTFVHLKFPMAMDKFFTGLKISSTYAFIAATVAEWLGGSAGLGVYMVRAKSSYALDKVFACTLLVVLFSLLFVGLISIFKKILIKWR
jgi:ABC transporter, permease protein